MNYRRVQAVSRPARPRYIPYAITFWGVGWLFENLMLHLTYWIYIACYGLHVHSILSNAHLPHLTPCMCIRYHIMHTCLDDLMHTCFHHVMHTCFLAGGPTTPHTHGAKPHEHAQCSRPVYAVFRYEPVAAQYVSVSDGQAGVTCKMKCLRHMSWFDVC